MPVYNCRQYIADSVNSIINQTFSEFELIIIDDGSSDGTYEYLQTISDPRIILIRKPQNSGYTVSLNMGLQMAKGEYIARMDGDDISFTDRFAKQVEYMDDNKDVVVCGGGYEVIGSDNKFIPKTFNEEIVLDLLSCTPIAHPTVFIRNRVLKKHNIQYNTKYEPAEDYKLWTVLSEYGKLANLKDIILYYRIHQNQTSSVRSNSQLEIGKLISLEYIRKLSKGNLNADMFCCNKLKTVADVKKYETVEADIISNLSGRGIKTNDKFFAVRKKQYLKQSLSQTMYSLPQAFRDMKLLFCYRFTLGNRFIIKYLAKSLICWNGTINTKGVR